MDHIFDLNSELPGNVLPMRMPRLWEGLLAWMHAACDPSRNFCLTKHTNSISGCIQIESRQSEWCILVVSSIIVAGIYLAQSN